MVLYLDTVRVIWQAALLKFFSNINLQKSNTPNIKEYLSIFQSKFHLSPNFTITKTCHTEEYEGEKKANCRYTKIYYVIYKSNFVVERIVVCAAETLLQLDKYPIIMFNSIIHIYMFICNWFFNRTSGYFFNNET